MASPEDDLNRLIGEIGKFPSYTNEEKLRVVEELGALDSWPALAEIDQRRLAQEATSWEEQIGEKLKELGRQLRDLGDKVSAAVATDSAARVALLRTESVAIESAASLAWLLAELSARASAAIRHTRGGEQ
jgi:hypothetical protein